MARNPVTEAKARVAKAEAVQRAAWAVWNDNPTEENVAAWDRAVVAWRAEQDRAEDVADRWEANEAARDVQCDWWVAAKANAQCAA